MYAYILCITALAVRYGDDFFLTELLHYITLATGFIIYREPSLLCMPEHDISLYIIHYTNAVYKYGSVQCTPVQHYFLV